MQGKSKKYTVNKGFSYRNILQKLLVRQFEVSMDKLIFNGLNQTSSLGSVLLPYIEIDKSKIKVL